MKEDVLEQVTIEKLAAKANEYAQARKGPIIDGKYVYSQVKPYEKGKQSVIGNRESGNLKVMNDSSKMSGEKKIHKKLSVSIVMRRDITPIGVRNHERKE